MRHQVQCLFTFGKAFKRHGDIAQGKVAHETKDAYLTKKKTNKKTSGFLTNGHCKTSFGTS